MTDLIDDLRRYANFMAGVGKYDHPAWKAADEIERLQDTKSRLLARTHDLEAERESLQSRLEEAERLLREAQALLLEARAKHEQAARSTK